MMRRLLSVVLGGGSLLAMVVLGKVGQNLCNLTPEETFQKDGCSMKVSRLGCMLLQTIFILMFRAQDKDCTDTFAVMC